MQIIDKILYLFKWLFTLNFVKYFIAYATLINYVLLYFIAVQCFLSMVGYSNSTAILIYSFLKPFVAVNLMSLMIQGYLVFNHKFCKWTQLSWVGGFIFNLFWIVGVLLKYKYGYKLGVIENIILLLLLSYFIIFVIINIMKVNFKCCYK